MSINVYPQNILIVYFIFFPQNLPPLCITPAILCFFSSIPTPSTTQGHCMITSQKRLLPWQTSLFTEEWQRIPQECLDFPSFCLISI